MTVAPSKPGKISVFPLPPSKKTKEGYKQKESLGTWEGNHVFPQAHFNIYIL